MDNCKSLLTSLYQREAAPLFQKEGSGEIFNDKSSKFLGKHRGGDPRLSPRTGAAPTRKE
jgi:hypothetical protein